MLTTPSKSRTSSSHVADETGVKRTIFVFGIQHLRTRVALMPIARFHSAEQAGGETVSMAITTVLSQRSARRVSPQILHRLKTKNIRITVKLLGMCTLRRARRTH